METVFDHDVRSIAALRDSGTGVEWYVFVGNYDGVLARRHADGRVEIVESLPGSKQSGAALLAAGRDLIILTGVRDGDAGPFYPRRVVKSGVLSGAGTTPVPPGETPSPPPATTIDQVARDQAAAAAQVAATADARATEARTLARAADHLATNAVLDLRKLDARVAAIEAHPAPPNAIDVLWNDPRATDWLYAQLRDNQALRDLVQTLVPAPAPAPAPVPQPPPARDAYTPDSPIIGAPRATVEQAIAFVSSRNNGEYTDADVALIISAYYDQCTAVGVDPVLAIAQMCHETGCLREWWAGRPRRNPAGIGVTGETDASPADQPPGAGWAWDGTQWRRGLSFADWVRESIPAHVGRLLAYALPDDQLTPAQRQAIDVALRYRPLPTSYRGIAPTLRGLNGTWAVPGHTYADKLAEYANAICRTE